MEPNKQSLEWTNWDGAGSWEDLIEQQRTPLYEAILNSCGIEKGMHFLDSGCGSGGLAYRASIRGASVSGFDISGGMIALARQKIRLGDFRIGSLDAPPFEGAIFDVVAACDCLFFATDASKAVKHLARLAKENGAFVVAVWEAPERSEYSTYYAAMIDEVPRPPENSPLALSEEGVLEALLDGAGLHIKETQSIPFDLRFPSFDQFWQTVRKFGVIQNMIDAVGEQQIREAAYIASKPCILPSSELRYRHAFRVLKSKV